VRVLALNFVVFQLTWFSCVLGGAWGWPWAGVGAAAACVGVHGALSPDFVREAKLIAAAAVIGLLWDSALVASGLLVYPSGQLAAVLAPVWILALWVGFATCINVSLRWLKARLWLAAAVGAVAGPMSFWGGSRLGAVSFPDPARLGGAHPAGGVARRALRRLASGTRHRGEALMRSILTALVPVLALAGCAGRGDLPPLPIESQVDLPAFMGDWYVIGGILTPFEDGAHNAVETYRLEGDDEVPTRFRFRKDGFEGRVVTFSPRGFVRPGRGSRSSAARRGTTSGSWPGSRR
jgi:hypothetical protein